QQARQLLQSSAMACVAGVWLALSGTGSWAASEPLAELLRQAASPPLLLLGEVHDNAQQHALRQRAFEALLKTGARPALLMEQFDRERQADIDQARAQP